MKDDTQARLKEVFDSAMAAIVEMVAPLLDDDADDDAQEEAREAILNDPLAFDLRSGWYAAYKENGSTPDEFRLLLTTGGPAVQIVGDVSEFGELENPRLQVQDWFTPWTEFFTDSEQDEALQVYVQQFMAF